MIYRFLHLSDIHFGQEKNGTLVKHNHVRDALVRDVRLVSESRGVAKRILVTGDAAFSATDSEYKEAAKWLDQLAAACGCKETDVSVIPGNHDCDLEAISNQARMICAQLRSSRPELARASLHNITQDGEAASPFLPKLQEYKRFASSYGCDFHSAAKPIWIREFDLPGGVKLRFHGLTSVQISDKEDARGNMILGNEQFTIAEEENIINVVLVHHPLDWFLDEDEATRYVKNNCRVLMVGHEHKLVVEKTTNAFNQKELLTIFAGATNPPSEKDGYHYAYNWLEFSYQPDEEPNCFTVEVFPRFWNEENVCFETDRKHTGAGESARQSVACQNLKPAASVIDEATTSTVWANIEIEDGKPSSESESQTPLREVTMITETADFARLRYLFWQYLDWQQRLKVLVEVDALPQTASQPIPQTLERIALDKASKSKEKLHALWEAVMPLVPQDKRSPNPFQS